MSFELLPQPVRAAEQVRERLLFASFTLEDLAVAGVPTPLAPLPFSNFCFEADSQPPHKKSNRLFVGEALTSQVLPLTFPVENQAPLCRSLERFAA